MTHPDCRCPQCWGFREYIEQLTGSEYPALPKAPGHEVRLRVLTFDRDDPEGAVVEIPCTGSLVCDCPRCVDERAKIMARGSRTVRQPWEVAA